MTSAAQGSAPLRGRIVLVGTPIGNLSDISPRAAEALAAADVIACEDTRRTGRLLSHLGISSPGYVVLNEHTEGDASRRLIGRALEGSTVVVVSDAGMPGVSDPGEHLVASAVEAGVDVEVVPGPSAVLTALVVSGLATARFVFEGFIPRKGSGRSRRLEEISVERRTIVLFEAPHRLERTLTDLAEVCGGDRRVVLARELTKMHEEIWRGSLSDAVLRAASVEPRGEYVIVLDGAPQSIDASDDDLRDAIRAAKAGGATTRDAVDAVTSMFGVARRRVYELALGDSASE